MAKIIKKTMARKQKIYRQVARGKLCVLATFNNTLISVTDLNGEVLAWSSAGSLGFKGARKSTPYAAQLATKNALEKARPYGLKEIYISVSGVGPGREQAIRAVSGMGLLVLGIKDVTPVPHGGCRIRKPRRV